MAEEGIVSTADVGVGSAPIVAPATAETPPESKPAEVAPATEPAVTEPETPEQAARKETSKRERKLARLHREIAEQKVRAEQAERRAQEAEAKTRTPQEAPRGKTIEDFNWDAEAYAAHKAELAKESTLKELSANQAKERSQQAQAKLTQSWAEKVEKADAKYEDWDEVVGKLEPTTTFNRALMHPDLPNGEDVAHYLGKNIAEAKRIIGLDDYAQILAIGRLSATLGATPAKPADISKAPAPIKPVSGSGPTAKKLADMNYDEFEKARKERIAKRH